MSDSRAGALRDQAVTAEPSRRLSRAHAIVGALAITETVSWGILFYAFAVFLIPMADELGAGNAQIAGALSLAIAISGVAGIAVGRWIDHASPRPLMTLGSVAGAALVVAWSRVESLAALYAVWAAIGLVMAAVLYEPAFAVVTKWFTEPDARRRALTAVTLVAALASFIFLPLSQALIDAHGWRDALLVLAAILALVTVPLHAGVLRRAASEHDDAHRQASTSAAEALRSTTFWLLTGAFFLGTFAGLAAVIHLVVFLVRDGYSATFAAFATGLIGIMQIPGRLLFEPLSRFAPRPIATAIIFVAIAAGLALIVLIDARAAVLAGVVLLGMGNGMTTLARATALADLYGPAAYGLIGGVAASGTTGALAAGPILGALWAALFGYHALLWTLAALALVGAAMAFRAETRQA